MRSYILTPHEEAMIRAYFRAKKAKKAHPGKTIFKPPLLRTIKTRAKAAHTNLTEHMKLLEELLNES